MTSLVVGFCNVYSTFISSLACPVCVIVGSMISLSASFLIDLRSPPALVCSIDNPVHLDQVSLAHMACQPSESTL